MLGRNLIQAASGNVADEAAAANAWDVEFASFEGSGANFFVIPGVSNAPQSLTFKSDGTKFFVIDYGSDTVDEYSLSTAWDVSTASYQHGFSVSSQESIPTGVFFRNDGGSEDGKQMYVIGYNDNVSEYDLTTAWDVSTASYSQNFSVSSEEANPRDVFFKNDGTKMYIVGSSGDEVNEYDLSTAWDVSTASYNQNFSVSSQDTNPTGLFFRNDGSSDDGKKMYIVGDIGNDINEYNLSTAWDISTASFYDRLSFGSLANSLSQLTSPADCFFKSDGSEMFILDAQNYGIVKYDLSTSWSLSTASFSKPTTDYLSVSSQDTSPESVFFKGDGTKMYVAGNTGNDINEYSLSTAWAVETASFTQTFSVSGQETGPSGLFFRNDGSSEDGKQMYVTGTSGDDVNEYSLSTAWDVSTASYTQNFSVVTQEGNPSDVQFKTDGTKMYVVGSSSRTIFRYSLSTAWDVSTASYDGDSAKLSVSSQDSNPGGFFFKTDGTRLYLVGNSFDRVYQYNLSTAWDVSTASYDTAFQVEFFTSFPKGVFFKPDGQKFYTVGSVSDAVTAFTIT